MDARLLSHVADAGRIAVHEIAAALGMDPRDVAARLVALSATGLPLLVGVECDQKALRAALNTGPWAVARQAPPPPPPAPPHAGPPPAGPPPAGPPSGPPPAGAPPIGPPSGPHPVHGPPSGRYPVPGAPSGYPPAPHGAPSGPYPVQRPPSGPYPVQGPPSGRNPVVAPPAPAPEQEHGYNAISTWGPPQTSSWARGDQPPQVPAPQPRRRSAGPKQGVIGDKLRGEGLDGEQVDIQLVEVVDPADFLFSAAGYRLAPGERAVVVHTELTNASPTPYPTLPDLHLVLVTSDGRTITKAPVSLSSRPPHRIGVQPGKTAGGHAVFVLPESTAVTAVRWSARPDATEAILTWQITD